MSEARLFDELRSLRKVMLNDVIGLYPRECDVIRDEIQSCDEVLGVKYTK